MTSKNMKFLNGLLILSYILILSSCNSQTDYILKAESVIEMYPDSALQFLDSIIQPNLLSEKESYNHNLLRIQAKDKLYQDITQDTAIFKTANYYLEKGDIIKIVQSKYYCGRLLHETGYKNKAIQAYLEASRYAERLSGRNTLKGVIQANIGYLLFSESNYKETLNHFKIASDFFQKGNEIDKAISIKIDIGNCYMMMDKTDSAYFYYNEALTLADVSGLPRIKLMALQNLGLVYQLQGNSDIAINLYKEALPLADSIIEAKIYLSLTRIYSQISRPDSANYFFDRALSIANKTKDPYFNASLDEVSSEINERIGNYKEALSDYKNYAEKSELLSDEREQKAILDIQNKYNFERIKNQNNELYIRNIHFFGWIIFLGVALLIVSFLFYYHIQKKKRLLDEAENKILQLDNLALSYNEKRNSFRDILLHHFDILKKSATLQNSLREDEIKQGKKILKKFNDIVYRQEELDWNILYDTMNELHDGFLDELKQLVPNLDESEFKICCLIHSGFTNQEMAIIMKLSYDTISHKRTSIRKKMGMKGYKDISKKLKQLSDSL